MSSQRRKAVVPWVLRAEVLAEVDAEAEAMASAATRHGQALATLGEQVDKMLAEHAAAVAEARKVHGPVPTMPPLPDGQPHRDALLTLGHDRSALAERRTKALAAGLPVIVAGWEDARPDLDAEAARIAADAAALARRYAEWWRLVNDARLAAEQPTGTRGRIHGGPSTRMWSRPEAVDVLAAAAGRDLCAVPVPGPVDAITGHVYLPGEAVAGRVLPG